MTRLALTPTCAAALLALTLAALAQTTTAPDAGQGGAAAPVVVPEAAPAVPAAPVAPAAEPAPPVVPLVTAPEASAPAAAAVPAMEAPVAEAPAPAASVPSEIPAPDAPAASAELPADAAPLPVDPGPGEVVQPLPHPHDLSPMGMYNQADWVVKSVILSLLAACFLTWTVWLFKTIETFVARGRARRAARILTRAHSLAEATRSLAGRRDPAAFMAHAVLEEYKTSDPAIDPSGPEGVKERAASLVGRVEVQALARLRRGMGLLATVGSVAPFVGLFGTVWGIMNAFIGIAETQTTNLAVVAPGIAEALFATAIGLVAAIPAVVIYNHFTRAIASYKQALGDAGAATQRLLSRDIDFRNVKGA